jgi:class 3 adenylate cyclase
MTIESPNARESPASPPLRTALLTFLIADLRGFTSFTAEQGNEAAARLAGELAELCQDVVAGYDVEVI